MPRGAHRLATDSQANMLVSIVELLETTIYSHAIPGTSLAQRFI